MDERFPAHWRKRRALFAVAGSFAATVLFALYNGALGIAHSSVWHGSICAYYIQLSVLRGSLLAAGRKVKGEGPEEAVPYRRRVFYRTSGLLLVMDLALAAPVALMVMDRRPVRMGMIPAIASASYTTYKIAFASIGPRRGGLFQRELHVIRLIDALVSVLILQNTLIVAVEGAISQRMFPVVAVSSAAISLLVFSISLVWIVRGNELCQEEEPPGMGPEEPR